MANYKVWMNRQFAGCRKVANAYDPYRQREVQLFMMPGEFEYVGVYDGVDAWVAPVVADPFSVSIKRIFQDVQNGKEITILSTTPRRPITASEAAPAPIQRRPIAQAEPQPTGIQRRPLTGPGEAIKRRPVHP